MPLPADLQSLFGASILVGLMITATAMVLFTDWHLTLFALTGQYLLLAPLLTTFVQPPVAAVRILSGALAVVILYITRRNAGVENQGAVDSNTGVSAAAPMPPDLPVFTVGFPFRLFAVAFVAVAIIGSASSMTFLGLAPYVLFSSMWLMATGILVAVVAGDALRLGLGILMFTGGFGILDTALEGSLFLYGLLNIFDLLLALVIAHLAALPREGAARRRRGETR